MYCVFVIFCCELLNFVPGALLVRTTWVWDMLWNTWLLNSHVIFWHFPVVLLGGSGGGWQENLQSSVLVWKQPRCELHDILNSMWISWFRSVTQTKPRQVQAFLFSHAMLRFVSFLHCTKFSTGISLSTTGVKAVFSGHYHRNAGGCHGGLDMVVSSAIGCQLGDDTHGIRVVVVTADGITHRYHSLEQLSAGGMDQDLRKLLQAWWSSRTRNSLALFLFLNQWFYVDLTGFRALSSGAHCRVFGD